MTMMMMMMKVMAGMIEKRLDFGNFIGFLISYLHPSWVRRRVRTEKRLTNGLERVLFVSLQWLFFLFFLLLFSWI
jgi:hypothetical protein